MNNNTTNNTNTEARWNKAREQRDKLLEHYNTIIKPTLLEFYELTGEDVNIKISLEDKHIEIICRDGQTIEYEVTKPHKYKSLMGANHHTIESIAAYIDTAADEYIKSPNIKVIKVFSHYWSKIQEYMDTRIESIASSLCLQK